MSSNRNSATPSAHLSVIPMAGYTWRVSSSQPPFRQRCRIFRNIRLQARTHRRPCAQNDHASGVTEDSRKLWFTIIPNSKQATKYQDLPFWKRNIQHWWFHQVIFAALMNIYLPESNGLKTSFTMLFPYFLCDIFRLIRRKNDYSHC